MKASKTPFLLGLFAINRSLYTFSREGFRNDKVAANNGEVYWKSQYLLK